MVPLLLLRKDHTIDLEFVSMAENAFLQRLNKQDVVLCAEGYLFELERRGYISAGPFVPEITLKEPAVVAQLHRDFLRAGAEVMVAFTYYGHRNKMRAIGKEDLIEPLNRAALRLAREVAAEDENGALVAANLSNTWEYDPNDASTHDVVREMFREQMQWAVEEGVDLAIAETFDYVGEARIATEVIREFDVPAVVTYAAKEDQSYDGYDWPEACAILENEGAAVVGLNCARGPLTMLPLLERIRARISGHLAAQPVPYRTTDEQPYFQLLRFGDGNRAFPVALDPFTMTRFEMAEFATKARNIGVDFIGICCGGAPHHVRAMAEALGRTTTASEFSPDLSLHPVLGEKADQTKGAQDHKATWQIEE